VLELAVLGLLKEKPMHGYEVHSSLEERLGRNFSFGSIYPTLKRLTKRGALEVEEPHAAASLRSRKRILYHLTPAGEALFEQLLDEAGPHVAEDRDAFMMRLAFFGYTRPETRRRLLERRRGYLLEQLERMKASLKNLKERVDAYSLELMRYGESETMRELRWLDDRIAFEAASEDRKDRKAAMKAARKSERRVRRNATMHNKRDKETTDAPTVAPTAPAGADLGGAR
jgi:DNA-binding PadR family transcriptional regulator